MGETKGLVNDEKLTELTQRIDKVEKQNRQLKLAVLGAALFIASIAVMGAAPSGSSVAKVLRTERLEIVDMKGQVRAKLYVASNPDAASPILFMQDTEGKKVNLSPSCLTLDCPDGTLAMLTNMPGHLLLQMQAKGGYVTTGVSLGYTSLVVQDDKGRKSVITPGSH